MQARVWASLCGAFAVASCTAGSSVPNGSVVFDETVALERGAQEDRATREVVVDGDAILVAVVDENLTDVRVALSIKGDPGNEPVEVENHLEGAGIEIATRAVPRGARVAVTLTGAPRAIKPGSVHLKLQQFVNDGSDDGQLVDLLSGYQAWSAATAASFRAADVTRNALPAIDRAIASFQRPGGDVVLAAEAQRIKANLYHHFKLDAQKSYELATRAVEAFQKAGSASSVPLARTQLLQALTLVDVAADPKSTHPPAPDASIMARTLLTELGADRARLARVERARAYRALGLLDLREGQAQNADYYLDLAQSMHESAGHAPPDVTPLAPRP